MAPPPTGEAPATLLRDGLAHHRAGRTADAEAHYRQVLAQRPDDPDALHLMGVLSMQGGRAGEALGWLERAARLRPKRADIQSHLGMAYRSLGRFDDAIEAHGRAIAADPTYGEAVYNLANAYRDAGRPAEAEATYRRAIDLDPKSVEARLNLGALLWESGRAAEAAARFEEVLKLDPDNADAHNNLGGVLKDRNLLDEAAACFERALAIRPDFPDALQNLGNVRRNQGRLDDARAAYGRALAIRPDDLVARWSSLLSLPNLYDSEDQIDDLRDGWAAGLDELCDTIRLDTPARVAEAKRALLSQTNFNLHYQGRNDRDLQARYGALLHRIAAAAYPAHAEPRPARPDGRARRRIGFVSNSFYRHTVCHLFGSWIGALDRDAFEVHVFHGAAVSDAETARLKAGADRFHTGFRGGDGLLDAIARAELDVVVYPDIGMAPMVQLPAALRLAPLQCASWGHPVTTGLPTIDVYLSSVLMEPADGDRHYTERLQRLSNLSIAYPRPVEAEAAAARVDGEAAGDRPLYVCMQSLFKLLPGFDPLIARIAREVGSCRFLFFEHASPPVTAQFKRRLARAFAAQGLAWEDFCAFRPVTSREDYFAFNRRADVLLDSLWWSGGKTSLDAFACDRPVVTRPGPMMRGRHTLAMYERMGISDPVARDADDYVAIAVGLGRDPARRREIGAQIAAAKHLLFDDPLPLRELGEFFKSDSCCAVTDRKAK